jgi:type IV pilus assembly protein PilP
MLAGALVVMAGCGEEETAAPSPTPSPTRPAATTPASTPGAAPAAEASAAPPAPTWAYNPVGKRDPFRSYLAELKAQQSQGGPERKLEETEKFELDQYQLRGLITGTAQPSAMVEDPTGKGHVLHVGAKLGKRGGRVTRITSTGIIITEEIRAPTGERIRVPITIALPQPDLGVEGAP